MTRTTCLASLIGGFLFALLVTSVTGWGEGPAAWVSERLAGTGIVPVAGFDGRLGREIDELQYPETRPLFEVLVIDQVVEHARQARFEALRAAGSAGWQVPLPTMTDGNGDLPPRLALGRLPGDGGPVRLEETGGNGEPGGDPFNPAAALMALAAALLLVILRRRR